jgi:hypothetical protein
MSFLHWRSVRRLAMGLVLFNAAGALAAEPTQAVWVSVVLASNKNAETDAALMHMKQKFSAKGITYQSYKRLSSEQFTLSKGKSAQEKLPNGKTATLRLEELKGHRATLRVTVPPIDSAYELGRDGSLFMLVGQQGEDALIMVLSPRPLG